MYTFPVFDVLIKIEAPFVGVFKTICSDNSTKNVFHIITKYKYRISCNKPTLIYFQSLKVRCLMVLKRRNRLFQSKKSYSCELSKFCNNCLVVFQITMNNYILIYSLIYSSTAVLLMIIVLLFVYLYHIHFDLAMVRLWSKIISAVF